MPPAPTAPTISYEPRRAPGARGMNGTRPAYNKGRSMRRALLAIALAAVATVSGRAADRPWTIVRSATLTIVGQQPAKTLRTIAVQIEQFRAVLGALFATAQRPLPVPTLVYVFGTHQELAPFLPGKNGAARAIACASPLFRPVKNH